MGPHPVPTNQKEQRMTETPQQPTTALTEDEQKIVRSAALRAGALVAQAEPGFLAFQGVLRRDQSGQGRLA